jgi:hypothetical protein
MPRSRSRPGVPRRDQISQEPEGSNYLGFSGGFSFTVKAYEVARILLPSSFNVHCCLFA